MLPNTNLHIKPTSEILKSGIKLNEIHCEAKNETNITLNTKQRSNKPRKNVVHRDLILSKC